MPTFPLLRRVLAVALLAACVAAGKACQPRVCTVSDTTNETTTTAESADCREGYAILDSLRLRDPGGDLDLGRD